MGSVGTTKKNHKLILRKCSASLNDLERADPLALVCGVCCEFVTFPLVSWVRCGTWLYRFLIFTPLLTSVIVGVNEKMLNLMPWSHWRLTFLRLFILVFSFYSRNTHLLPPKPKFPFHHLKRGFQNFHMKYVLVPADKAANNVVVVWRLYYGDTLKRELIDTNAYTLHASLSDRFAVDGHGCYTAQHLGVKAKENQDKIPTLYWLPELHKSKMYFSL